MMNNNSAIEVLHVDDEPDLAEVVSLYLEREDEQIQVETATDVSEGLEKHRQNGFDCIVSDYDMPGKNGIEFLREIRESRQEIPFILYTGKGSEEVASEAISAGVTDYLQKETGTAQYTVLAHRIRGAVEGHRSRLSVEDLEQKLSELAERTDDILFMYNGDWSELLFINSSFEDIWGMSVEELGEDPGAFLELIHEDDREQARESMELASNGEHNEVTYRVVPRDGDVRWVQGEAKPIFDDDGNVSRIAGFVRDITEYKRSDDGLHAIDSATEGLSFVEEDGTFSFVNETFAHTFGYESTELVGRHWKVLYHEEEADRLENEILPAVYETGYWSGETVRLMKSGSRRVTDHRLALTNEGNIVCTAHDVTPDRMSAGELCHGDRLLTDTLSEHAFYTLDHEGYITRWNDGAEELMGYDAPAILGKHIEEFYTESAQEAGKPEELLARAREEGTVTEEGTRVRGDGSQFELEVTMSASFTGDGILQGYGKLQRPISE